MSEIFLPVEDYEGYFIGSKGTVWSLGYGPLKPRLHNGYEAVELGRGNKEYVHRLVAKNFIGNKEGEVNHKNFERTDNRVLNLEWVSRSENIKHAVDDGRYKSRSVLTKSERAEVKSIWQKGKLTQKEIGEMFGITQSAVSRIVNNQ